MSATETTPVDVVEQVDRISLLSREDAAAALAEVDDFIDAIQRRLAPALNDRARLQKRIRELVVAENAAIAIAGEYRVTRNDPKPVLDRRIGDLRELYTLVDEGLIPEADVKAAIWEETPEPVWKTHLTKLKKLEKYGDRVRAILARGLVETTIGAVTYSFERIRPTVDVTPTAAAVAGDA